MSDRQDRYSIVNSSHVEPRAVQMSAPLKHSRIFLRRETLVSNDGTVSNTYTHGNEIEVNLKAGSGWTVPLSQRLRFKCANNGGAATVNATLADGASSLFDLFERDVADIEAERIDHVNKLAAVRNAMLMSSDFRAAAGTFGLGVGATINHNANRMLELPLALYSGLSRNFQVFPNRFCKNGERFVFRVAPLNEATTASGADDCTLTISEVELISDVVHMHNDVDRALARVILGSTPGEKLVVPLTTYYVQRKQLNNGDTSINLSYSLPAPYLNGVLFFNQRQDAVARQNTFLKFPSFTYSNMSIYLGAEMLTAARDLDDLYSMYNHSRIALGDYHDLRDRPGYATYTQYSEATAATAATVALFYLMHTFHTNPESGDHVESIDNTLNQNIVLEGSCADPGANAWVYCAFERTRYLIFESSEVRLRG